MGFRKVSRCSCCGYYPCECYRIAEKARRRRQEKEKLSKEGFITTRQFIKGARAFCCDTNENNVQGLIIGREYDIIEANHVIDGEEYIVVSEHHTNKKPIRVKAEHFV